MKQGHDWTLLRSSEIRRALADTSPSPRTPRALDQERAEHQSDGRRTSLGQERRRERRSGACRPNHLRHGRRQRRQQRCGYLRQSCVGLDQAALRTILGAKGKVRVAAHGMHAGRRRRGLYGIHCMDAPREGTKACGQRYLLPHEQQHGQTEQAGASAAGMSKAWQHGDHSIAGSWCRLDQGQVHRMLRVPTALRAPHRAYVRKSTAGMRGHCPHARRKS